MGKKPTNHPHIMSNGVQNPHFLFHNPRKQGLYVIIAGR
jgi:hypothetical protein